MSKKLNSFKEKILSESLTFKILSTMLIVSTVPLLVISGIHFENMKQSYEETKFNELNSALDLKIQKINVILDELKEDLNVVKNDNNFRENINIILHSDLQTNSQLELKNDIDNWLRQKTLLDSFLISDTEGKIKFSTNPTREENIDEDVLKDTLGKITGLQSNEVYFSKVFRDEDLEMMMLTPIYGDGRFLGIIGFEIDLQEMYSRILDDTGLGDTGEIILGQKSGDNAQFINSVRYSSKPALDYKINLKDAIAIPIRQAVQGDSDFGNTVDYRNEPIFASWDYIPETQWGVVAKIDSSEVYNKLESVQILNFAITAITITGIIIISSILTTKILIPIVRLKNAVKELEKGNYEQRIRINEKGEVGELVNSVKNLRESLRQNKAITKAYENELEYKLKGELDLRKALDESSIVAITDKKGDIMFVNDKFTEISKYSREELIGKNHRILKSGFHPPEFYTDIWRTISNGNVWKGDIKNKAKDGSYYWVKTTIVPFLGKDGKPKQYIAVRTDITKQKEIEMRLSDALDEVKKSEKLKSEFASMVTHELKTPLTPIRGYCEMLTEQEFGSLNKEQSDFVKTIDSNAERLERLISDVLDVQKLDMNRMSFEKTNVGIDEFLDGIRIDYAPLMKEKQIHFNVQKDSETILLTDKQRLRQVFDNLIRNAMDFVPENGHIDVGFKKDSQKVTFFVKDDGIGISKEKQKDLFKKFYQVDTSYSREHGGTGLGLVVCKGIIEGQNGEIWVESEPGKGSTFYFSTERGGKSNDA